MEVKVLGGIFLTIMVIAALLGGTWLVQGNNFFMYKVFAPKYEETKREVFQQSKEYQHGTFQELDKMRLEYVKTEDLDIRGAIEARTLRMVAEFDKSDLPADIRLWIYELEEKR